MPALIAAASSLAVVLGAVSVEAGTRLAARGREVRMEGRPDWDSAELEAVPRLALVRHGGVELSLSYAPRLTLPFDISAAPQAGGQQASRRLEVLHRGDLTARGAATPNLSLRLAAGASYGRLDLLRAGVYTNEVLPTTRTLAWRSIEASAGATATPTPLRRVEALLSAFETGGADSQARAVAPLRRGAAIDASARHAASPRDEVSVNADATWARFTPAEPVSLGSVVRAGAGWRRLAYPTLSVRAAAGGAWSRADSGTGIRQDVAPFAEVTLTHAPPRPPLATELAVRLSPYMSPLTGAIDQRLEATARTTWRPSETWVLEARGAGAATRTATTHGAFWTGRPLAEIASAEARAAWSFARHGWLSLGPSVRWQRGHGTTAPGALPAVASAPTFLEWGAVVEATMGVSWPE